MDRSALQRFIQSPHRTFRWNEGDRGRYDAIETTDEGLVWFSWSHDIGGGVDGAGGEHARELQSYDAFHRDGPLRPVPTRVAQDLAAWLIAHGPET